MATKSNKSSGTKVTRIKATDPAESASAEIVKSEPAKKRTRRRSAKKATPTAEETTKRSNPFRAIGGYFAGAWYELRQVHWPNRRATWSMTLALILFTVFFVVVILLLDALFQYLFKLTLG